MQYLLLFVELFWIFACEFSLFVKESKINREARAREFIFILNFTYYTVLNMFGVCLTVTICTKHININKEVSVNYFS